MIHIGHFADTVAILISIVLNSYYWISRGANNINLPPEHLIMSFETIEIKMATVSAKQSMYVLPHNQRQLFFSVATCSFPFS